MPKIYFLGYLSFKFLFLEKCWRDSSKSSKFGAYLGRVVLVLVRPKCGASHGGWRNLGWRRRRCGLAGPVPRNPGPAQPTVRSSDAVRIPAVLPVARSSWCSGLSSASSRSASSLTSKVIIFFDFFLDNPFTLFEQEGTSIYHKIAIWSKFSANNRNSVEQFRKTLILLEWILLNWNSIIFSSALQTIEKAKKTKSPKKLKSNKTISSIFRDKLRQYWHVPTLRETRKCQNIIIWINSGIDKEAVSKKFGILIFRQDCTAWDRY